MKIREIRQLEVSGSGCGDIRLTVLGLSLTVEYEYTAQRGDLIGRLRFERVTAYRFRDEMHSWGYPSGAYDAVVEVQDSNWLAELVSLEPAHIISSASMHHFAVLFSSNGLLEVVADSVVFDSAVTGRLPLQ